MIRIVYFLAAFMLCSAWAKAQKKEYMVSAVAFYNFENLFDTLDDPNKFDEEFTPAGPYAYGTKIYREKLHNLATVIKELGTAITPDGAALIGTAEIENATVLTDLAAQPLIKDRNYQHVWFEGPDARGIDVALLYNPKYFKVKNARSLRVDLNGDNIKGGSTRDVLYVEGELLGEKVHVLVNHWPSRRGGEAASAPLRAIAASVGKRMIDSIYRVEPSAKIILMGDLNDDPVSPSLTQVLKTVGDKDKVKPKGLYNPWVAYYKAGKGTLAYNDSWNLFDQIIISEPLLKKNNGLTFWKSEIFHREYLISNTGQYRGYPHRSFDGNRWINGYSDHLPTIIYLLKEKN